MVPSSSSVECPGRITDLIVRCGRGDEAALGHLFDLTYSLVRAVVGRVESEPDLADELVLDVFVELWRSSATYDPLARDPLARGPVAWIVEETWAALGWPPMIPLEARRAS